MMYNHYCRHCKRIHMLNGHKKYCPACRGHLNELKISYLKYVNLAPADRRAFRDRLGDPAELAACTADMRRSYDYAKWLQLTSKVEHSHSQNYAAYSH